MTSATTEQRKPEITIVEEPGRVTVEVDGVVVADSTSAVVLTEGRLPPRHYLPVSDLKMDVFIPNDSSTH